MVSKEEPVTVAVIGGTGLYKLDNLQVEKELDLDTAYGKPSSAITIARLESGKQVAFLARHGHGHSITPSHVPVRANIAALKSLGVRAIVAFSAVGSLREEIRPKDLVIPSQIIDRTKGIRPSTFFDGGIVAHAMFGDPFDTALTRLLGDIVKDVLKDTQVKLHTGKTVVVMEGPQFSTRAESLMYRQWGGDIINMSALPEAKLAREAEISYALICTSTDYDAWRESEEPVTVAEVMGTLKANSEISKTVAAAVLDHVHDALSHEKGLIKPEGGMQYSIVTARQHWPEEQVEKLKTILPAYFS
ncbi:uncharacterized protein L969DRAFT_96256 [Mixia osmundae IAM 14324]|uniref:S-methyl-5'-thioadenosine phosphorylase n=1 Tax=Mixia osmundae (strain CBS 9802 / IAM 14324 / JCM 22182 / KY 12970) TaxID=764103 RepID=G7E4W6_MIXOS|nr:uncharacterized protein L969DRAFT_96256 [Mixia osmundae IAM 14324]KEI37738.1 hypothetical protein L969DRAFT_96256 [Mixia osmundae IAM 14324]GAA97876.1 hypothetical protein E5Q_04556 [Mixia osmundae IAM 14324]